MGTGRRERLKGRRVHVRDLKAEDLKSLLKERGLHLDGSEAELRDRLASALHNESLTSVEIALASLLSFCRAASAIARIIVDCDEVYNYIEPIHHLINGSGLQTWEHSARFALRSYLFVGMHALPPMLAKLASLPKVYQLLVSRMACATICTLSELSLARTLKRLNPGRPLAARFFLALSALNAGMFSASSSVLPSASAMCMLAIASKLVLQYSDRAACAVCSACVLLTWPFAGMAAVPIGFLSLRSSGFVHTFVSIVVGAIAIAMPSLSLDWYYYDYPTWSVANLIRYNVFSAKGSSLYGTEPFSYYVKNLALNMNAVPVLSALHPLLEPVREKLKAKHSASSHKEHTWKTRAIYNSTSSSSNSSSYSDARIEGSQSLRILFATFFPMVTLIIAMTLLPHKEERFLYPMYSCMIASAALSLDCIVTIAPSQSTARWLCVTLTVLIAALHGTISVSRVAALLDGNKGSDILLRALNEHSASAGFPVKSVCYRNLWHRFPSHFFIERIAESEHSAIQFVPGGFNGALPVPFHSSATQSLNDRNQLKSQMQRQSLAECDYALLTATEQAEESVARQIDREGFAELSKEWIIVPERSPTVTRSFFVPYRSRRRNEYEAVSLLRRQRQEGNELLLQHQEKVEQETAFTHPVSDSSVEDKYEL